MKNLKHFTSFVVLILMMLPCFAQPQFGWGLDAGSSNRDEFTATSMDAQGNTYVSGVFEDSLDVVEGLGVEYVKSQGWKDIFLAKYSPTGDKLWAFGFGNLGWDQGWAMTTDGLGNVYSGGVFTREVDFDPSNGTTTLTSNTAGLWPDGYLAKYDTDGNLQWAKHLLTARDRSASQSATLLSITSMEVDFDGNLVIGGAFWDTVWLSPSRMLVSDGPLRDMFLAKYDTDGNLIWGEQLGGPADQQIQSLATDDLGNIFTTGYFLGSPDFDPAGGAMLTSSGLDDIFLAKYTSAGALDWVKGVGSPNGSNVTPEMGMDVGTDASGNVYVTGRLLGPADFDPTSAMGDLVPSTSTAVFMAKYSTQGNYDWAFTMEGGAFHLGKRLAVFPNGDFYLAGEFGASSSIMDLDPSPSDTMAVTSLGNFRDIFIAKYDTDMKFLQGRSIRGLGDVSVNGLSSNGNDLVIGGWYTSSMLFNRQSGDLRFSNGSEDMYALRFSENPNSVVGLLPSGTLKLFPNPAHGNAYIRAGWSQPQSATIRFRNIHGQSIFSWQKENTTNVDIHVPLDNLPSGFYIVELELTSGKAFQKLRIE